MKEKPKFCCPHVRPFVEFPEAEFNHILFVFCPQCGDSIRYGNIRPSDKEAATEKLVKIWNHKIDERNNGVMDEIKKIVDTQK